MFSQPARPRTTPGLWQVACDEDRGAVERMVGVGAGKLGVQDLAGALDDGALRAPGEVDPAVGTAPDVVALDHGPRLLVDHRRAHVLHVVPDERVDELD